MWNGDADVTTLDRILTPTYIGHIGSRTRDIAQLMQDIAAYRAANPAARFRVEHQFGDGDYVATRLIVQTADQSGSPVEAAGINISRWDGKLLAEEWAVWEPVPPKTSPAKPNRSD